MTITEGSAIADEDAYVGVVKAIASNGKSITLTEQNGGVFVIPTNEASASNFTGLTPTNLADLGYTASATDSSKLEATTEKQEKSYYVIESAEKLTEFVTNWNKGDEATLTVKQIKFAADMTYDYTTTAWTPLGTWQYPFNGTIDGMGCTIKGLGVICNTSDHSQDTKGGSTGISGEAYGLIGIAGNGDVTVKNINFDNLSIKHSEGNMVGAVIGFAPGNAEFYKELDYKTTSDKTYSYSYDGKYFTTSNVHEYIDANNEKHYYTSNEGNSFYEKWYNNQTVGYYNVTISNVNVSGEIEAKESVGGLVGKAYNFGNITISNCTNNANITATSGQKVAGILGYAATGNEATCTIENCTNNGTITNKNKLAAAGILLFGFNGNFTGAPTYILKNNVNNGNIITTASGTSVAFIAHPANERDENSYNIIATGNSSKSTATITVGTTKITNGVLVCAHNVAYTDPKYIEANN